MIMAGTFKDFLIPLIKQILADIGLEWMKISEHESEENFPWFLKFSEAFWSCFIGKQTKSHYCNEGK